MKRFFIAILTITSAFALPDGDEISKRAGSCDTGPLPAHSDKELALIAAQEARETLAKAKAAAGKMVAEIEPAEMLKFAMIEDGNPARGKLLFTRQSCVTCHAVDQKSVPQGPYLGSVGGKFTKDYLIKSILDPNAAIAQGFQTEAITMADGTQHFGFVTGEEDGVIEFRNIVGIVTELKESEIKKRDQQEESMMPVGLVSNLTLAQFNDLIAYLVSMKE